MQLITTLSGKGFIRLETGAPSQVQYRIDVWRDAAQVAFGRGRISGPVETIFRASLVKGAIPLALADNRVVEISITERGAGNDWAEIYVPDPLAGTGGAE